MILSSQTNMCASRQHEVPIVGFVDSTGTVIAWILRIVHNSTDIRKLQDEFPLTMNHLILVKTKRLEKEFCSVDLIKLMREYRRYIHDVNAVTINVLVLPNPVPMEAIQSFVQTYCDKQENIEEIILNNRMKPSYGASKVQRDEASDCMIWIPPDSSIYYTQITDNILQYDHLRRKYGSEVSYSFFLDNNTVVAGGTFDRLHSGHYLFLQIIIFLFLKGKRPLSSEDKDGLPKSGLILGLTKSKEMMKPKEASSMIEDYDIRLDRLHKFFRLSGVPLDEYLRVVPLVDRVGPAMSTSLGNYDVLVCTDDTIGGAINVNMARENAGLRKLRLLVINGLNSAGDRISSSRKRNIEKFAKLAVQTD